MHVAWNLMFRIPGQYHLIFCIIHLVRIISSHSFSTVLNPLWWATSLRKTTGICPVLSAPLQPELHVHVKRHIITEFWWQLSAYVSKLIYIKFYLSATDGSGYLTSHLFKIIIFCMLLLHFILSPSLSCLTFPVNEWMNKYLMSRTPPAISLFCLLSFLRLCFSDWPSPAPNSSLTMQLWVTRRSPTAVCCLSPTMSLNNTHWQWMPDLQQHKNDREIIHSPPTQNTEHQPNRQKNISQYLVHNLTLRGYVWYWEKLEWIRWYYKKCYFCECRPINTHST